MSDVIELCFRVDLHTRTIERVLVDPIEVTITRLERSFTTGVVAAYGTLARERRLEESITVFRPGSDTFRLPEYEPGPERLIAISDWPGPWMLAGRADRVPVPHSILDQIERAMELDRG